MQGGRTSFPISAGYNGPTCPAYRGKNKRMKGKFLHWEHSQKQPRRPKGRCFYDEACAVGVKMAAARGGASPGERLD